MKNNRSKSRSRSRSLCTKQGTKKYNSRNGPAYPANKCPAYTIRKGNDGNMYINIPNKHSVNIWKRKILYKLDHGKWVLKSSLSH